jgi:hypothetical protein
LFERTKFSYALLATVRQSSRFRESTRGVPFTQTDEEEAATDEEGADEP